MAKDEDASAGLREWSKGVTAVVAAQVSHFRARRAGMSVTQLAAAAGMPRVVLSNLLNGQRESVSVAELYALASALDVPPGVLMVPIGAEPDMEVTPGHRVSTSAALRWVTGVTSKPGESLPEGADPLVEMMNAAIRHEALVLGLRDGMRRVEQAPDEAQPRQVAWRSWTALRACRDQLRAWGLLTQEGVIPGVPPALPNDLAWADTYRPDPAEERQADGATAPHGFAPGDPPPWVQVP